MMKSLDAYIFSDAVREFWQTRERQAEEQRRRGAADQGFRGAVTGSQQMNGFIRVIRQLMIEAGVNLSDIHLNRNREELPGFFVAPSCQ
jgi:hypothetical protein